MSSIPCVVVPSLNAPHLIQRLIASIDFPIETLLFVHNFDAKQPNREVSRVIQNAKSPFVSNLAVHDFSENVGVAGAWNFGVMARPECTYSLLVNSDVSFANQTLRKIAFAMNDRQFDCKIVTFGIGWSAFAMPKKTFHTLGPFDENLWPAYSEDCDYVKRLKQQNCALENLGERNWFSHFGSASWKTSGRNTRYFKQISHAGKFFNNFDYMEKKWHCNREGSSCASCDASFHRNAPREWQMDFQRRRDRGGPLVCISCNFTWSSQPS